MSDFDALADRTQCQQYNTHRRTTSGVEIHPEPDDKHGSADRARKLDSLRRCLDRVRECCPADVATLAHEPDLQDIVVLNLSRAAQICVG